MAKQALLIRPRSYQPRLVVMGNVVVQLIKSPWINTHICLVRGLGKRAIRILIHDFTRADITKDLKQWQQRELAIEAAYFANQAGWKYAHLSVATSGKRMLSNGSDHTRSIPLSVIW